MVSGTKFQHRNHFHLYHTNARALVPGFSFVCAPLSHFLRTQVTFPKLNVASKRVLWKTLFPKDELEDSISKVKNMFGNVYRALDLSLGICNTCLHSKEILKQETCLPLIQHFQSNIWQRLYFSNLYHILRIKFFLDQWLTN